MDRLLQELVKARQASASNVSFSTDDLENIMKSLSIETATPAEPLQFLSQLGINSSSEDNKEYLIGQSPLISAAEESHLETPSNSKKRKIKDISNSCDDQEEFKTTESKRFSRITELTQRNYQVDEDIEVFVSE